MTNFKIYATFNVFEEAQFIREAIEAVLWCDGVIVVDGAFPGFPSKTPYSADGTLDIVHEIMDKHPAKVKLFRYKDYVETTEKMNCYLAQMELGDYFLRLNGDEIVESSFATDTIRDFVEYEIRDRGCLPMYQIPEYYDGKPHGFHYEPKLLKKTSTLKLTSRHVALTNSFEPPYELLDGQGGYKYARGQVAPAKANLNAPLLRIRHMKQHRNPTRQQQNVDWVKYYRKHQMQEGII